MIPDPHQELAAEQGYAILAEHMICYLAMEERTGKTLSAILICEMANVHDILVITKKGKPLKGWQDDITAFNGTKKFTVINYHSLHKLPDHKYDLVILDEAHNYISGYPKRSKIWQMVSRFTKLVPIIYVSATPHAQTMALLYNQFALSSWSPWRMYSNFYEWYKSFGTGKTKYLHGQEIKCYDSVQDDKVKACVNHLFVTATRKEVGFTHEPKDILHYINLDEATKDIYNLLISDNAIEEPVYFLADTVTLIRTGLHQLEGGTLKTISFEAPPKDNMVKQRKEKVKDEDGIVIGVKYHNYYVLDNDEKIQYIKDNWGDSNTVAIMYHYIAEGFKLREAFKNAEILQATTNAEGVDLSNFEHLVIYSQDFSTARHSQRRARQANRRRATPINIHFLLVKDGVSEQVYRTVSVNKENYVDSVFIREELK